MPFRFGRSSLKKLAGVNPDLVKVANSAIETTAIDFGISQGLRTQEEQDALRAAGKSFAKRSKHQDGEALDLFAWIDGAVSWRQEPYPEIVAAFADAAFELGITIRWGGAWNLLDIRRARGNSRAETALNLAQFRDGYVALRKRQGRTPFVDAVHVELN